MSSLSSIRALIRILFLSGLSLQLCHAEGNLTIARQHAEDIFRSSLYTLVSTNPDGRLVTYIERMKNGQRIMLLDLKNDNLQIILNDPNDDIIDYHWIDNDTLVLAKRLPPFSQSLQQLNINFIDGELEEVYERPLLKNAFVIDSLPRQEDRVLIKYYAEEKSYIYNLNLSSRNIGGQLRNKYKLNRLAPSADSWLSDGDGHLRIGFTQNRHGQHKVWYRSSQSKRWDLVWNENSDSQFTPVLYKAETESIVVLSNHKRNYSELLEFDLNKGAFSNTLLKIPGIDIESVALNNKGDDILYASYTEDGSYRRHYFTELGDFVNQALNRRIRTENIWVVDSSLNNKTIIALKRDSQNPGVFYLFDAVNWRMDELADTQPWLKNYALGHSNAILSTSTDGLEIESYLTSPSLKAGQKPPLIVMPHGGPISVRSYLDFDPHVQYLSTLGYAVLRPNFRGSSGYGQQFKQAGKRQWGKLIEDDIQSAVEEVIRQGLVDPDKICIYGSSYGGYSALMSAIRKPEMFKCAASYVGVTDISLMHNNDTNTDAKILEWRKEFVGDPETQMQEFIDHSPVYQAHRLEVPVFLAQGGRDWVVDKEHFFRMRYALERHNKMAEYLVLDKEGHGFSRLDSYYEFYSHLDRFFRKHLKLPSAQEALRQK